ncbi:MAG: hypothetical protein ABIG64_04770 [Candidatus Omnitrophota bacterium]
MKFLEFSRFLKFILILFILLFSAMEIKVCSAQINDLDSSLNQDPELKYYQIIEQRNFFRPQYDPSENEYNLPEEQTNQTNSGLDFVLTGVIEIKNGYKAIVEKISQKKGFYVSINDAIEDYLVRDIKINKIILERNEQVFELKLNQGISPAADSAPEQTQTQNIQKPTNPNLRNLNTMQKLRMGIGGQR